MNRKDFDMVAFCFNAQQEREETDEGKAAICRAANTLAIELSLTYPRFDRDKFMTACGFPPNRFTY